MRRTGFAWLAVVLFIVGCGPEVASDAGYSGEKSSFPLCELEKRGMEVQTNPIVLTPGPVVSPPTPICRQPGKTR